jgi:hypothetical protein
VEDSGSFHRTSPDAPVLAWLWVRLAERDRAMAYIENGRARLVSRKENAHKSFPALTTRRPTIRRTAGPERFIYSLRVRPFTITGAHSFASVVAMVRPIPAVDPRNQSSLFSTLNLNTRPEGIGFVRVRTLHPLWESVDYINP